MLSPEDTPPHAYIPGQTPRHAEGAFDHIRETARAGMSAQALAESRAFRVGLAYLDAGYFWEAHEVLEPVWMALPQDAAERRFVQALIQLANAYLKVRMDRPGAALRLCGIVRALLDACDQPVLMGEHVTGVERRLDSLRSRLK